ncbi:MAG: hypothetical protein HY290_13775 [Planctomycetia bacterium]|nr:hypothetical protein [Planctomycetia bacterium]
MMPAVTRTKAKPAGRASRRGAFTSIVLVCLLISTMLMGALLKIVLLQNRQAGRELGRVQAGWLAESGLDRAAARLAGDPNYAGETWTIAADRLARHDPGVIVIRVEKVESRTSQRLIVVEAAYPPDGPDRARVTRQATMTLREER